MFSSKVCSRKDFLDISKEKEVVIQKSRNGKFRKRIPLYKAGTRNFSVISKNNLTFCHTTHSGILKSAHFCNILIVCTFSRSTKIFIIPENEVMIFPVKLSPLSPFCQSPAEVMLCGKMS